MRWPWRRRQPINDLSQQPGRRPTLPELLDFPHVLKDESLFVQAHMHLTPAGDEWWERHAAEHPAPTIRISSVKFFDGYPGWAMVQGTVDDQRAIVHVLVPIETLPEQLRALWLPREQQWQPQDSWADRGRGRSGRRMCQVTQPAAAEDARRA